MDFLRKKYASSAEWARIAPFAVFVVLTALQADAGSERYWLYAVKTAIGAWMVWEARPFVSEMRWKMSLEAVLVGVAIFGVWVGLDGFYPRLSKVDQPWNPHMEFGVNSGTAWFYAMVRLAGSTMVVPPLEEVFYRSFLYRYFVKIDFLAMPLGQFHALSFAVTSILFGLMHPDRWLAGILCGLGYQWLTVRKNRLGDAMCAHAITNFLLGLWVILRGAWSFW
jgi:CAAX prenyl protease-like protein